MDHGASGETCGDSASPVGAEGQYGKCLARAPTPASVTDLVEQVTEQTELERLARRMYEETFDLMKDPRLGKVARGKVTLLYGPPMVRPACRSRDRHSDEVTGRVYRPDSPVRSARPRTARILVHGMAPRSGSTPGNSLSQCSSGFPAPSVDAHARPLTRGPVMSRPGASRAGPCPDGGP